MERNQRERREDRANLDQFKADIDFYGRLRDLRKSNHRMRGLSTSRNRHADFIVHLIVCFDTCNL